MGEEGLVMSKSMKSIRRGSFRINWDFCPHGGFTILNTPNGWDWGYEVLPSEGIIRVELWGKWCSGREIVFEIEAGYDKYLSRSR